MPSPQGANETGPSSWVLIVDDQEGALRSTEMALQSAGIEDILCCVDSSEVENILREKPISVLLLDLNMPGISGEELLARIVEHDPSLPVIILTGKTDATSARYCLKKGAKDYLQKPVDDEELIETVEAWRAERAPLFERRQVRQEYLRRNLRKPNAFAKIVTASEPMLELFARVDKLAPSDRPLMIRGETGTGKGLLASAAHEASGRTGPFVPVHVGSLAKHTVRSELFGHVAGAFAGAIGDHAGYLEKAAGGTIFLDQVAELSPDIQVALLRVLQDRCFQRVGSTVPIPLEARIITATSRGLDHMREEFVERITTHEVEIPALRDRPDDLPLLVKHFLTEIATETGRPAPTVPPELFIMLEDHPFPRNVRELQNVCENAFFEHEWGVMRLDSFLEALRKRGRVEAKEPRTALETTQFPHPMPSMKSLRLDALVEALTRAKGNKKRAAAMLEIDRGTLDRSLKKLGEEFGMDIEAFLAEVGKKPDSSIPNTGERNIQGESVDYFPVT